jgi:Lrp/AsnC family transcriptional regulator for asnA, asnC and gidA
MYEPDSMDEQLVKLLGRNARQNSEALAKQLNISSATVRRRLRRLIRGEFLRIVGVVHPTKFGFPLTVVINLSVVHDKVQAAIEELSKQPEMQWVAITTGQFDISSVAWFRSTEHLSEFMTNKLAKLEGLRDTETLICLDVKKGRYEPFA